MTLLDDVKTAYDGEPTWTESVLFACGHLVVFPDDALKRAADARSDEDRLYWEANSTAHKASLWLAANVDGGFIRPCPGCPGKRGEHQRGTSRTVTQHLEGREDAITAIEIIYDPEHLRELVNRAKHLTESAMS